MDIRVGITSLYELVLNNNCYLLTDNTHAVLISLELCFVLHIQFVYATRAVHILFKYMNTTIITSLYELVLNNRVVPKAAQTIHNYVVV